MRACDAITDAEQVSNVPERTILSLSFYEFHCHMYTQTKDVQFCSQMPAAKRLAGLGRHAKGAAVAAPFLHRNMNMHSYYVFIMRAETVPVNPQVCGKLSGQALTMD